MKCPKCDAQLPEGAKFCPNCGAGKSVETPAPEAKRKRSPLVYVIAGLAAIALIALVFAVLASRGNVTNAPSGSASPGNVTNAPAGAPNGGNVLNAPPGAPPTGQQTPGAIAKPKPPQEVVDYLAYVKKVEDHRQMLLKDTTTALSMAAAGGAASGLLNLIDMAGDPDGEKARDPLADTKKELNRQYKNWISTLQYLDKRAAPPECREFSGTYRDVIFKETRAIGEIAVNFNAVNVMNPQDMSKLLASLEKMKGDPTIQGNIDKAADTADTSLDKLVANYDMQKPFSVPRESKTSGSIMGF
ncbi:zinc ribbon domain-containing protein [bacterium]|nr:zinc ribbon domain-containing protein [bacterium]